jgi:RimJ/RimL family protein N-acetyltransferase
VSDSPGSTGTTVISTSRLRLRAYLPADVDERAAMFADKQTMRYYPRPSPGTRRSPGSTGTFAPMSGTSSVSGSSSSRAPGSSSASAAWSFRRWTEPVR